MDLLRGASILVLAAGLSGCATVMSVLMDTSVHVDIDGVSDQDNVEVTAIDVASGQRTRLHGRSVKFRNLSRTSDYKFVIRAEGFETQSLENRRAVNGWFWWNFITVYPFGMLVDWPAGTMWVPERQYLHVQLGADRLARERPAAPRTEPATEPEEFMSDVDEVEGYVAPNPDRYALIIGIEKYGATVPPAEYARRDAHTFNRYAQSVLGVPQENVIYMVDEKATLGALQTAFSGRLKALIAAPSRAEVFVYYSGHGAPDVKTSDAYLVPFDGDPMFPSTSCYPLSSAYEALSALKARSTVAVLDACFSGASGRGDSSRSLIGQLRPLHVSARLSAVPRNLTVFAAARGDQTSAALNRARHGLFTYYFLRGLRGEADTERTGKVTVRNLARYLEERVVREARRQNREQHPTLLGNAEDRPLARSR